MLIYYCYIHPYCIEIEKARMIVNGSRLLSDVVRCSKTNDGTALDVASTLADVSRMLMLQDS